MLPWIPPHRRILGMVVLIRCFLGASSYSLFAPQSGHPLTRSNISGHSRAKLRLAHLSGVRPRQRRLTRTFKPCWSPGYSHGTMELPLTSVTLYLTEDSYSSA